VTTLGQITSKDRAAAKLVTIPRSAFADDWADKPTDDIVAGLRLVAEKDQETATIEAAKYATRVLEGGPHEAKVDAETFDEIFNSRIMVEIVARTLCDPNDVTKPHPTFPFPEDQIPIAFSPRGIRLVWAALERAMVELSPVVGEASNADLQRLAMHVSNGSFDRLRAEEARSARRFADHLLSMLDAAAPTVAEAEVGEDEEEGEDDGPAVYHVAPSPT
jgi:hypothetical protein